MSKGECFIDHQNCILPGAVDQLGQGVFILSLDGRVCYVNRWLCDFLGYAEKELLFSEREVMISTLTRKTGPELKELHALFRSIVANGASVERRSTFFHKNGMTLPVLLKIICLNDAQGRKQAVMYLISDAQEYVMSQITKDLQMFVNLQDILEKTINIIVDYLGLSSGAIFLYQQAEEVLQLVACNVFTREELEGVKIPMGVGAPGKIAQFQKPVYVENLRTDPEIDDKARQIHAEKSSIGYPMVVHGHLVGVIAFDAKTIRQFSAKEKKLFAEIADRVGVAIYNAQMVEHLKKLSHTDELTGLFNHRYFQQEIRRQFRAAEQTNAALSLLMLDIDHFKVYNDNFGHLAGDKLLTQLSSLVRQLAGPQATVARYGGEEFAVILSNTSTNSARAVAESIRGEVAACSFAGYDRQPGGAVTVSVGIANYPGHASSYQELIKLADQALYLAKNRGRNRVEVYYSLLDELVDVTGSSEQETLNRIKTLIILVNSKDDYTFAHSERVTRYSVQIAEEMGLDAHMIDIIRYGAYLHDIGKIEIPREILTKTGPLTGSEFERIKSHPQNGYEIVKPIKAMEECLPIILHHHERYDGGGYPAGLRGEQIPPAARIVTVADSFDAMLAVRPYKGARTLKDAILELKACAGSQFDPHVVDIFVKLLLAKEAAVG